MPCRRRTRAIATTGAFPASTSRASRPRPTGCRPSIGARVMISPSAHCDRIERRRQRDDRGRVVAASGQIRKARVVAEGDNRSSVQRECDTVDVLRMALEEPRGAAAERPQRRAVWSHDADASRLPSPTRSAATGRPMPFEHGARRLLAGRPDGMRASSPLVAARPSEQGDRIDGAVMEAQHLLRRRAFERPADRDVSKLPESGSCRRPQPQARGTGPPCRAARFAAPIASNKPATTAQHWNESDFILRNSLKSCAGCARLRHRR